MVRDNQVIGQVNIVVNEKIPQDEALKIVEINLLMNGFTPRAGGRKSFGRSSAPGKIPRNFGIPIFSITRDERDNLTPEEELVTSASRASRS